MDDDDRKMLRALGVSEDRIKELQESADRIRRAKEATLERLANDKGLSHKVVAEVMGKVYSMLVVFLSIQQQIKRGEPFDEMRLDRNRHTILHLSSGIASDLQAHFDISPADMDEIHKLSQAVVDTAMEAAHDFSKFNLERSTGMTG